MPSVVSKVLAGVTYQAIEYGENEYLVPTLSAVGLRYIAKTTTISIPLNLPVLQTLNTLWDKNEFSKPREPWTVQKLEFSEVPTVSVLDLPIKFPGTDYRVPDELSALFPVLKSIFDIECTVNPMVDSQFSYLTVDSRPLKEGHSQRQGKRPRAHVDGFQGGRVAPKTTIEHHYVLLNYLPTWYHLQEFDITSSDEYRDNVFDALDSQVDWNRAIHHNPFDLLFLDSYTVHSAAVAPEDHERTFIRLSYGTRVYDRLGNSHNPMFDYNWRMVQRDFNPSI